MYILRLLIESLAKFTHQSHQDVNKNLNVGNNYDEII
jgi:hypothetical protein